MDIFAAADSVASAVMHAGGWPILLLYQQEVPPPPATAPINVEGGRKLRGPWNESKLIGKSLSVVERPHIPETILGRFSLTVRHHD